MLFGGRTYLFCYTQKIGIGLTISSAVAPFTNMA